ncbi:hypothetical protein KCP69_11515 [Salmonella enterica subsp. enterica]|nr:hypothetical protein KCP69_11515 [Salmonella enterica subsp. enterica]
MLNLLQRGRHRRWRNRERGKREYCDTVRAGGAARKSERISVHDGSMIG